MTELLALEYVAKFRCEDTLQLLVGRMTFECTILKFAVLGSQGNTVLEFPQSYFATAFLVKAQYSKRESESPS